jgi:hypothetical protein
VVLQSDAQQPNLLVARVEVVLRNAHIYEYLLPLANRGCT